MECIGDPINLTSTDLNAPEQLNKILFSEANNITGKPDFQICVNGNYISFSCASLGLINIDNKHSPICINNSMCLGKTIQLTMTKESQECHFLDNKLMISSEDHSYPVYKYYYYTTIAPKSVCKSNCNKGVCDSWSLHPLDPTIPVPSDPNKPVPL